MKLALVALVAGAGIASASGSTYLVSDDSSLYRGTIGGGPAEKFDFLGGEHLIGMTIVPDGAVVTGANPGDVIAVDDQDNGRGYNIYRVDNAFSGTPTLAVIGVSDRVSNSLAFRQGASGGWELYGANGLGQTFKVHSLDLATFAGLADLDSGFGVLGVGGLQFASTGEAYFTVNGDNSVNAYDIGTNTASAIGPSGAEFTNNGLEFLDGTLYGAVGLDSGRIAVGSWNTGSGAFSQLDVVAPSGGGVMGFVFVPGPGTLALLGLGGLVAIRRRR